MSKFSIPIARTNLTEDEITSVLDPLKSGWLVQGPKVKEFEEKWSEFTGSKNSIAVTSCTAGLHISLAALDFGPGDEAIVPAFTWISTANVVEHLGAKVVFCDIDLKTFNISVRKAIKEKYKRILIFSNYQKMNIDNYESFIARGSIWGSYKFENFKTNAKLSISLVFAHEKTSAKKISACS